MDEETNSGTRSAASLGRLGPRWASPWGHPSVFSPIHQGFHEGLLYADLLGEKEALVGGNEHGLGSSVHGAYGQILSCLRWSL